MNFKFYSKMTLIVSSWEEEEVGQYKAVILNEI
jgi:hypothetical protein